MDKKPLIDLIKKVLERDFPLDKYYVFYDIKHHLHPVIENDRLIAYEEDKPRRVTITLEIEEK